MDLQSVEKLIEAVGYYGNEATSPHPYNRCLFLYFPIDSGPVFESIHNYMAARPGMHEWDLTSFTEFMVTRGVKSEYCKVSVQIVNFQRELF